MQSKLVSIMIPLYNQEDLIIKALDSIPARDDIEVVVCDDCSTDNSYEVVKYYNRIPIKLFKNETNKGVGYTRNVCLDNCTGEYVFGLDSDDTLNTGGWLSIVDTLLDGNNDLIRVSRKENSGRVLSGGFAFHTYFVKRSLLDGLRCVDGNHAEDYFLYQEFIKNVKKEVQSPIVAYNYNYPREGSLSNLWEKRSNE